MNERPAPLAARILKCLRCGHEWIPYKRNPSPRQCPRCKSAYWNVPKGA